MRLARLAQETGIVQSGMMLRVRHVLVGVSPRDMAPGTRGFADARRFVDVSIGHCIAIEAGCEQESAARMMRRRRPGLVWRT
jgi:hypothetical protein